MSESRAGEHIFHVNHTTNVMKEQKKTAEENNKDSDGGGEAIRKREEEKNNQKNITEINVHRQQRVLYRARTKSHHRFFYMCLSFFVRLIHTVCSLLNPSQSIWCYELRELIRLMPCIRMVWARSDNIEKFRRKNNNNQRIVCYTCYCYSCWWWWWWCINFKAPKAIEH